ncbi:UDP-Glycosyltransferase/glycogen phosphorylase [Podospora didyma]|uniref:UDP-Glycosyltransferase/glycogen phosphorylase n=1 Tax=Podospora didyma TaxID=330526 RepID=A0AAE0TVQ4_9PEZI|nr:UDP-Glycosyltransferase/glycogen phosphorylase [Podospora didyma]
MELRVILVQTAQGLDPSSGGFKANVNLLRQLADLGHHTAQICYAVSEEVQLFVDRAKEVGIQPHIESSTMPLQGVDGVDHTLAVTAFTDQFSVRNIVVDKIPWNTHYPITEFWDDTQVYLDDGHVRPRMKAITDFFCAQISKFRPTHVVFNDPVTMKATLSHLSRHTFKRVAIVHSAEQLPFGPYCARVPGHCLSPKAEDTLLRGVDGIWTVSKALQRYAKEHGNLDTTFLVHSTRTYLDAVTGRMPVCRRNVHKKEVGMVNPCPAKGLTILIALAKELPHINFVVWESWGSKERHLKQLAPLANVVVEPTTHNTAEIWDRIRILLAPSVWFEAWGVVVAEAQLRGIPVVSSDAGGLREAKIGVPHCIPVKMVSGERDEAGDYIVPEQDVTKWVEAVARLVEDDVEYAALADLTREAAAHWLHNLDRRAHEKWLQEME